ncbi:MAG: autotransporter-associated beta strand repeat-containing protein [Verrucomicrobia bacterium]|nr:autotransporter-associated beta strand repeat-containing protein [Verrucomicrobiota bacterium]
MNTTRIGNPLRVALKHSALAVAVAAGLAADSVHALTTSQTYDLGTSPNGTTFAGTGAGSLFTWIAKGSLPVGSILRAVTVTAVKLEANPNGAWASDLGVFIDPTPGTPGGDGLLKIADDTDFGGSANQMNWHNQGQNDGPLTDTQTYAAWSPAIDLNTAAVMIGNGYGPGAKYSGTVTVVYDVPQKATIMSFGLPGNPAVIDENAMTIALAVPYGTSVLALAPSYTLSSGTCDKDNGGPTTYDFTSPVSYTVTDGATVNTYTVTVTETPASSAKNILSFGPGAIISGTDIAWIVPFGTDVTILAPTYSVSTFAAEDADFPSGTPRDFTSPLTYTITAQDTTTQDFTVTVTVAPDESTLIWNGAGSGPWDLSTVNWKGQSSGSPTPFFNGVNAIFDNAAGGTINIASGVMPLSTTVSAGNYTFSGQPITTGSLTKDGGGTLKVDGLTPNTYSGGTLINGGTLHCGTMVGGISPGLSGVLGTGPVTLGLGTTIEFDNVTTANALLSNGGKFASVNGWGTTWNGPVTLNAITTVDTTDGNAGNVTFGGAVSGDGGFIIAGHATVFLSVSNSYTGPTSVTSGTLQCNNSNALGSGALSISTGAKVNLNYSGEHNLAALTLGGMPQSGGTYGSVLSGAEHQNDTYFASTGTGMVRVPASSVKNMLTFSFGALGAATVGDTTITLEVPYGTDRTALAPTYTVSPGATGSPLAGTTHDFTGPQTYTVIAEDLSTKDYTVTVTEAVLPDIFTWATAASGNWSVPANWTNEADPVVVTAPLASGRSSYTLNFSVPGTYTATNNMNAGFLLNQLNLGSAVTLAGSGLAFVENGATLPAINQNSGSTVTIPNDLDLGANTTYGGTGSGQVNLSGLLSGAGSLTKNGTGTLRIYNVGNSFTGGTIINDGTLFMDIDAKLGTGPITLNGGTIYLWRFHPANALTVNGGTLLSENGFGNSWDGPITLNTTLTCNVYYPLLCSNTISGTGGLTKTSGGPMTLSGTNTYTGPTTVTGGTLQCNLPAALGGGALSISGSGKVNLNYSGTRNIASLTLGGVPKTVPGTYGSSASGATVQNDTYFAGTGTVRVGGPGFALWADMNAPGQTPGEDHDNDGVDNGLEYFMGQTGSSFTAMPGLDGTNTVTWTKDPAYDGTWQVQISLDLGSWTDATGTDNTTSVSYTLPPGMPLLFVRLLVTPTP